MDQLHYTSHGHDRVAYEGNAVVQLTFPEEHPPSSTMCLQSPCLDRVDHLPLLLLPFPLLPRFGGRINWDGREAELGSCDEVVRVGGVRAGPDEGVSTVLREGGEEVREFREAGSG